MQVRRSDVGDLQAFPGEAGGLPEQTLGSPGQERVEADEEQESLLGQREDSGDRLQRE